MHVATKIAKALIIFVLLVVMYVVGQFWWAGVTPRRPSALPADAAFLWAPYRDIPKAVKGIWLNCWQDPAGRDQCRVSRQNGSLIYQGEFIPYKRNAPVPARELIIDPVKSREYVFGVGDGPCEVVPLVFLTGGQVLIPGSKYEEGLKQLALIGSWGQ